MRDVKKTHGPVELAQGTSRPFSPFPRVSVFGGHPRALARLVSLAPSLDVPVPTFGSLTATARTRAQRLA